MSWGWELLSSFLQKLSVVFQDSLMKHRMVVYHILITLLLLQIGLNISKDVSNDNKNFLVPIFSQDAQCCPFKKVGDINYKLLKE